MTRRKKDTCAATGKHRFPDHREAMIALHAAEEDVLDVEEEVRRTLSDRDEPGSEQD
ncbi:hypothetical protein HJ590_15735 [Naumannella sp. ID2617S]|nr:hypothetical protein [Naumannella sp. ID2617S]